MESEALSGMDVSSVKWLIFLDLDDTVFQTRPKCPEGVAVIPGAMNREGVPNSFMTLKQRCFADWLMRMGTVVPTTGRDYQSLCRVQLPFQGWAILNHGGTVLNGEGREDDEWREMTRGEMDLASSGLEELSRMASEFDEARRLGNRIRLIGDFGRSIYLVIKHPMGCLDSIGQIHEFCRAQVGKGLDDQFRVIANGNNVAVLPRGVSKERALEYVKGRIVVAGEEWMTLGVGDSLSDFGFMSACDFSLMPRGSQLMEFFGRHL